MHDSLIDKLKKVIERHNQETGEKVNQVSVRWFVEIGSKGSVNRIEISVEK